MSKKRPSMVCSTPFSSPSKKRISLVKSPNTTLKRSESVISLDADSLLELNEDEQEKKAHRRSLALQSFQKTPGNLLSPGRVKKIVTPRGPKLNPEQIKQHYADCIKLSAENKINAKNAFGLHLLEYIATILEEKSDNFQVVGCTIDAGAKIYAGRVDSVHNDILKMLGTMGGHVVGEDGDEKEEDAEGASQAKKREKKKKKIKLVAGRTIEKNLNNIRISSYDLSFDVDPLVKVTARQSDEQSVSSLITYNVALVKGLLQYDSSAVLLTQTDEVETYSRIPNVDFSPALSVIPWLNNNHVICPTFDGFRFNNWNCDDEKSFYESPPTPNQSLDSPDTVPEPYVPGLENMLAEDESSEEETVEQLARQAAQKMTIDDLTMALEPTEYGYFNPRLVQMWAGPAHWRAKKMEDKTSDGQRKEKKKKLLIKHTFDSPEAILHKEFIRSRAKTKLAQTTLQSNKNCTNVLPQDIHYKESSLRRLSMRPLWKGKLQQAELMSSCESNARGTWYDYTNQHDTSNYCPRTPGDDDNDDHHSFGLPDEDVSFTARGPSAAAAGLSLIEAPRKIERININYARQAKKIDVKKLKSIMWRNLAPEKENIENMEPSLISNEPAKKNMTFSTLYKILPSQVSYNMAENLSVPIAFACLLHLANEHNLELRDSEDLSDISIITTHCR